MTLGECFEHIGNNPTWVLFYFLAIPFVAILAGYFGKGEGDLPPWNYFYSGLVFLVTIPGIFAITLNVYLFLFERQPIFETNIYTQILPIVSMLVTLYIVRKNIAFDEIPGFGKLSGLVLILLALIAFMWVLEKTHIIAITFLPAQWFFFGFLGMLAIVIFGWKKLFS
jgi:hypothetical protein